MAVSEPSVSGLPVPSAPVPSAPAPGPPVPGPAVPGASRPKRRRRFSLNGLAIQLSAFATSFTLVALLVVSGSQAAFVEQSEVLANYVPVGTAAPSEGPTRPPTRRTPAPAESPSPTPAETPVTTESEPEPELPVTQVELTDSDAGTALFGNELLIPGVALQRCIEVTYAGGSEPRPVLLYAAATSGELAPYLDLTIEIGRASAGSFGRCDSFTPSGTVFSGTLAGFAAAHPGYATGVPTWTAAEGQETRGFRFGVAVQAVPAAAGKSAGFGFSWETRGE